MITVKLGNLITEASDFDAIMHGCNCFHDDDSGIAAQVWDKFPVARAMSVADHDSGDFGALGTYASCYEQIGRFTLINAYTQYSGGANFDIHAFIHILKQVNEDFAGKSIGIPRIGTGIGAYDWIPIENALLQHAPDIDWTVLVYL